MSTPVPTLDLSFGGEFFAAKVKKYQETIVLVPFFGGQKHQLRRHSEFVGSIGFDSVIFDLKFNVDSRLFTADARFGMKHIWADQIEKILSELPGRKILYAFSNPSASAIEAVARRGAADIAGLVCDSGPSGRLNQSMMNYYKFEKPIRLLPLRMLAAWAGTLVWNPQFLSAIHHDLEKLPKGFPILSIRGWKDVLISPDQIDLVFDAHPDLDWTKLSLPKAGHLNGLKDFRQDYVTPVETFLSKVATPL
jgi:pimeloyl-ACP methyl ester carboxylesterase